MNLTFYGLLQVAWRVNLEHKKGGFNGVPGVWTAGDTGGRDLKGEDDGFSLGYLVFGSFVNPQY